MALPIITVLPNQLLKCRIFTSCENQLGVNVIYFKLTAIESAAQSDLQELAAALSNRFTGPYLNVLSANANYRGVGLQNIGSGAFGTTPSVEVFSNSGADVGAQVSNAMSKQTCGIITKRTLITKRNGRGRLYLPFPGSGDNTQLGHPTAGYITRAAAVALSLFTEFSVSTPGEGLNSLQPLHRRNIQFPEATQPNWEYNPIVDTVVRTEWGTQRRRGDYGRTNEFPV